MNVSKRSAKKNQIKKSIITMNNKTIHELRDIAKEQDLRGYYMLTWLLCYQKKWPKKCQHHHQEIKTTKGDLYVF